MTRRIALVKTGSFSHINTNMVQVLRDCFPDYPLDVIDLYDLLKRQQFVLLKNLFFTFQEFGFKLFQSRRRALSCYLSSTYLFHQVKRLVSDSISPDTHLFSLQTQSLFDASVLGVPNFVYTDHTILAFKYFPNSAPRFQLPSSRLELEKAVYRNAATNFTMSSHVQRSMIEHYDCPPDQVVCVYAGSNVSATMGGDRASQRPSEPQGDPAQKYYSQTILFVGVDWQRKGGPQLVEAFQQVLQVCPEAQLVIVGCVPQLDLPNCTVVGRVPVEQVRYYYEHAAIFCLPTQYEPFGIVFIEALNYKLAVVGSDVGAIPDFIINGESGYLVPPNDPTQLAKVLIHLLLNPQKCQELGEQGYAQVVDKYSWKTVGALMKQTIEPLLQPVYQQ